MKNVMKLSMLVGTMAIGCATTGAPDTLVEARALYVDAEKSEARSLAPNELQAAQAALHRAEAVQREDPGSGVVDDHAYVAKRLAERALVAAERRRAGVASHRADERYDLERSRVSQFDDLTQHDAEEELADALRVMTQVVAGPDDRTTKVRAQRVVTFEKGSVRIDEDGRRRVQRLARALRVRTPRNAIVIVGHADDTKDANRTHALSLARAEAVKDLLVALGIPSQHIDVIARGANEPIANVSPKRGTSNRRVDIVVASITDQREG